MIVAFADEEQVEAFGEKLTFRLDFRAITFIEEKLQMPMPLASAYFRTAGCPRGQMAHFVWAMLREHHPDITPEQALTIVLNNGADGTKVGFAVDQLLERNWPIPTVDDDKKKRPTKRSGRSKSSAASG